MLTCQPHEVKGVIPLSTDCPKINSSASLPTFSNCFVTSLNPNNKYTDPRYQGSQFANMQAQLERWFAEHPTAPRTGRIFEVPFSYTGPRIAAGLALAGCLWYLNPVLFWNYKPETLSPEFRAEAKKIGNVAVSLRERTDVFATLLWAVIQGVIASSTRSHYYQSF